MKTVSTGWRTKTPGKCFQCGCDDGWTCDGCACFVPHPQPGDYANDMAFEAFDPRISVEERLTAARRVLLMLDNIATE